MIVLKIQALSILEITIAEYWLVGISGLIEGFQQILLKS